MFFKEALLGEGSSTVILISKLISHPMYDLKKTKKLVIQLVTSEIP